MHNWLPDSEIFCKVQGTREILDNKRERVKKDNDTAKVSKEIGEYVDYEEIKK